MLSLIKNKKRTPFSRSKKDFYFEIKSNTIPTKDLSYHSDTYLDEVSSSRLFLNRIIGYYWASYHKKRIQWLKFQTNEQGEREKLPYLLFDEGILYYYPIKEIIGVFIIEDDTLILMLDLKMIKEEKSLLKLLEHKTKERDIDIVITTNLEVEKKFNFTELEDSKFESFIKYIEEIEDEDKSK